MLLKICMFRWTLNVELIIQISADNINPICKTLQRLQYIFHILIKPNKHEHNIRWGSSRYSMNFMQIYFQNKVIWSRQTLPYPSASVLFINIRLGDKAGVSGWHWFCRRSTAWAATAWRCRWAANTSRAYGSFVFLKKLCMRKKKRLN